MDHAHTRPQGAFSALLADRDLAHLERVLRRSLDCDSGNPILPPEYWRERLTAITRTSHLSPTQIQIVHRLYSRLDAYEAAVRQRQQERLRTANGVPTDAAPATPAAAARPRKSRRA